MTIYGVETTHRFGEYRFEIGFDSGNETGLNQRDVWVATRNAQGKWDHDTHVRTFYFEDVKDAHLQAFCKKFAEDADYRAQCLARTTEWAIRDALFYRNLGGLLSDVPAMQRLGSDRKVWDFIKQHWKTIVALSDYQRIQAVDSQFEPSKDVLDPEIRQAVERFNQIPGVKTWFSCQGVTGLVEFQGIPFLVVSPHERFAYITFEQLPHRIGQKLLERLTAYPAAAYPGNQSRAIWYAPIGTASPYNKGTQLISTGDNLAFRQAALELADQLVQDFEGVDPGTLLVDPPLPAPPAPPRPRIAGLLPERLAWLCKPDHIENTLRLVWILNHWAKDRDRLLYADRQGLYRVKAAILKQAFQQDRLAAVGYVDGTPTAFQDWSSKSVVLLAAEGLVDTLERITYFRQHRLNQGMPEPETRTCPLCHIAVRALGLPRLQHFETAHASVTELPQGYAGWILGKTKQQLTAAVLPDHRHKQKPRWSRAAIAQAVVEMPSAVPAAAASALLRDGSLDRYETADLALCEQLLGRPIFTLDEADQIKAEELMSPIQAQFEALFRAARETRTPLPVEELAALHVLPNDLFDTRTDQWDDLDETDRRRLDPEGHSLIELRYEGPTARYGFHLPFRAAESFVPADQIQALRAHPQAEREIGEYFGRAITEAEALAYPIRTVLADLEVNILDVCPEYLIDKDEYLALRRASRPWEGEDEDDWDAEDDGWTEPD